MKTDIKEEFKLLIHEDVSLEKLVEFLKSSNDKERKSLAPILKMIHRDLSKSVQKTDNSYGRKGTLNQLDLLCITGYYCLGYRDYKKLFWGLPFRGEFFNKKIHQDFKPTWLEKHLNDGRRNLNYENLLMILKEGWFTPTKELVVQLLPAAIYPYNRRSKQNYSIDALLKQQKATLEEHLWYLFEFPSNLNWSDRWVYSDDGKEKRGWKDTFETLIKEGKIDRMRVLHESLLTATRGFDKNLTGWFVDLFLHLEPNEQELLDLQEELFLTLNGKQSKPINTNLKIIKKLCVHQDFKVTAFLELCPTLLASDIKTTLNNTLMILDKIAKKHKRKQSEICLVSTQALIQNDEKIQVRAAKLIKKYGAKNDGQLQEELSTYQSGLFSEPKQILADFFVAEATEELETYIEKVLPKIREDNHIVPLETFEDLVFFFSQCFDNREIFHFDLFLAYLPQLISQLNEDNFDKIEPAFHRAIKQIEQGSIGSGQVESLMAKTFLDCVLLWISKNDKKATNGLSQVYQEKVEAEKKWVEQIRNYKQNFVSIEKVVPYYDNYFPLIQRLIYSKQTAFSKQQAPMLSTPSHAPSWIQINVLVDRLAFYQKKDITPDIYDFQIALSRLVIGETNIHEIADKLSGEYFDIVSYLVADINFDKTKCKHPNLWITALYRKNKAADLEQFLSAYDSENRGLLLIENTPWSCKKITYDAQEWDYKLRKRVPVKKEKKELNIARLSKKTHPNLQAKFFSFDYEQLLPFQYFLFYGNYDTKKAYVDSHFYENDGLKALSLSPFHPELSLEQWIVGHLKMTNWSDADEDRSMPKVLNYLSEIWGDFGEMTYLFVACSFLYLKEDTRQMAAELWIQTTATQQMKNDLLGHCLGKLQHGEYAPLKRFNDLLINRMFNISSTHNQALEQLLSAMIIEMNDIPIKGTKKLLETYREVLNSNNSKANDKVVVKLKNWLVIKSLSKILNQLIKPSS